MNQSTWQTVIKLPKNYLKQDIVNFYLRDPQQLSEQVSLSTISKGLVWQGHPALLSLIFEAQQVKAIILIDGKVNENLPLFTAMIQRMLGLTQPIELFEKQYKQDKQIGRLIKQQLGLRIPLTCSSFEAIVWAITGQQISVNAAIAIRRRLIQLFNIKHSSGLLCHPDANSFLTVTEQQLSQAGLSKNKAKTIKLLSEQIVNGELPLQQWELAKTADINLISNKLSAITGIGPWTVSYALLRGFGWLDGSLHGDVAVRRNLQRLLNSPEKLTANFTEQWLEQFKPWRALVAAHLWKMDTNKSY
ncbi:DNA-3-methyladenine glycosylase 2 [Entomomonas asaccharolytica]|uniref:DNA-3-methyladenine glycosylase II n=1 Tax=Entomomonas asaccharolytica TaxID=2785331 RepID=A0A974NFS6_9GAMM|nr:DNA-3-methyladenine glycosylase 2 [Entomomonas asaccharolytica]QQP85719.1 DNA-3-methyladenine glycosylase 2 [Entomomonas asaccharolytica]